MSNIEWTGETWNPISGCSRKSEGCQHCYAETMTKRLAAMGQEKYQGLLNGQNRFNGVIKFDEEALLKPLKKKKPTTYFVNSMSDLFHENAPDEWIDKLFAVMALCPQHTFQILTKRADRMKNYFVNGHPKTSIEDAARNITGRRLILPPLHPLFPNVWLGVSVENQKAADERIPLLLETPAVVRFLSCEPLLEEIDLTYSVNPDWLYRKHHKAENLPMIDWVIVGGESGTAARGCDIDWIRSLVEQCKAAKVPCFVKQLGKRSFYGVGDGTAKFPYRREYLKLENKKGGDLTEFPADLQIREMPL